MQANKITRATAAIMIAAFAGTAISIAEPPERDASGQEMSDGAKMTGSHPLMFVAGAKSLGMGVKNAEDKTLGSVDDLIIDRGSGRVRYVVVKSGAIMGMGGKLVTVPYSSFGWDTADKHLTLAATPEEIKAWPEFEKKAWAQGARTDDGYVRTIGKEYYDTSRSPWPVDARDQTASTVKGTVKSISRHTVEGGNEELVVVVSSPNGTDQEIVLGPSWYAAGNNSIALYRGAPIDVDVFKVNREGRSIAMAHTTRIGGKDLPLYDKQGRAMWVPSSSTPEGDAFSAAPFVLATELKSKPVDCRGETCGKVKDVVMECSTGRVVFLVVDPDKGFMGVGDENRLVPWAIMTRSLDGKVHLDADKAMITSGPTTPADLKTLATDNSYKRIYNAYDVSAPIMDGRPK